MRPTTAVVLVGGEGTRLRPLTLDRPKPLLPLMGRSFLHHVLDHLTRHGVGRVILSSPYLAEEFAPFIAERAGDPEITWITEEAPLGTGGAVLNALAQVGDEPFFVLNGDILTDLDLTAMADAHAQAGASVSISTFHVEDARPFGLIETDPDHRILAFKEKPTELIPGDVNAGTYLVDPAVLRSFPSGVQTSIEREIFPVLIDDGVALRAFGAQCYWMDLGTPEKYLQAHFDILEGAISFEDAVAAPFLASAQVDVRAQLGRWVVLADGVTIGAGADLDESVVFPGATISGRVRASVIGANAVVPADATVDGCVIGTGVVIPDGAQLQGERIPAP